MRHLHEHEKPQRHLDPWDRVQVLETGGRWTAWLEDDGRVSKGTGDSPTEAARKAIVKRMG